MARISWDAVGSRLYETGIDRGVLYIDGQPGVPWNGLTSVSENSSGGTSRPFYLDGEKYANLGSREEFEATLTAYTYPDAFDSCNGTEKIRSGLYLTKQRKNSFGLSYRTRIGNDLSDSFAYKIHLIYNVLASPPTKTFKTMSTPSQIDDFSWTLTSLPPKQEGYLRSSHVVIDSRDIDPSLLSAIEDVLYGNNSISSSLPTLEELMDLVDTNATLTVVDNGDGTATITAPLGNLTMLDESIVQITWPTLVDNGDGTITVSS